MERKKSRRRLLIIFLVIGFIILIEFIAIHTAFYASYDYDPNSFMNSVGFLIIFQVIIIFFGVSFGYLFYSKRRKERKEQTEIIYDMYINEIIYDLVIQDANINQ